MVLSEEEEEEEEEATLNDRETALAQPEADLVTCATAMAEYQAEDAGESSPEAPPSPDLGASAYQVAKHAFLEQWHSELEAREAAKPVELCYLEQNS